MGYVTISTYTPNTGLTREDCVDKYTNIFYDAVKKIKELEPKLSTKLCETCAEFKKYLEGEKGKLNECYQKQLLSIYLDKEDDLKNTIQKCTDNSQCSRNSVTQTELKGEKVHVKVDSCKEKEKCSSETATSGGETKLKILGEPSAAENLGAHGAQEKGRIQPNESVAGNTLHEARHDSANAVVSQLDGKSSLTEVHGGISHSQTMRGDEDSDSEVSCDESVCDGTTSDKKTCCKGTVKPGSDEFTVREASIRDTPPKAGDTSATFSPVGSDTSALLVKRPTNSEDPVGRVLENGSLRERLDSAGTAQLSVQQSTDMGVSSQESNTSLQLSREGNPSRQQDGNEATSTGNDVPLSTFSVDDDPMSIKTYITYSLIPLAFILLLMLIIKFTPLGMLFTKKKRKNRKLMNERLQRILLDNSNLRQRNVPLAYGAFDYQYNNQNYY